MNINIPEVVTSKKSQWTAAGELGILNCESLGLEVADWIQLVCATALLIGYAIAQGLADRGKAQEQIAATVALEQMEQRRNGRDPEDD